MERKIKCHGKWTNLMGNPCVTLKSDYTIRKAIVIYPKLWYKMMICVVLANISKKIMFKGKIKRILRINSCLFQFYCSAYPFSHIS